MARVYHTVKHHLSYNAADCGSKLDYVIFPDSAICKKTACGRTKAEAIVKSVLAPKSIDMLVGDLTSSDLTKPTCFSVSTDASNLKNMKMFPICVQYFTVDSGINKKLIVFDEHNDEHSVAVGCMIKTGLNKHGLDLKNVSAYSADNASVNYGVRQSVYTELQAENKNIVKANCNAHISHNTLRKVVDILDCDVESIVTAVYGHFSISANRRVELQGFFEFCDMEFQEIIRHVNTRWLSLGPAIERLLLSWKPIVSYFKSLGDECPVRLRKLLGLHVDNDDDDLQVKVTEAYLSFVQNLCCVFEKTVLVLEKDNKSFCELYAIMHDLRSKLKDRLSDKFFGFGAQCILKSESIPPTRKKSVEANFLVGLQKAVTYLEQWFDFSPNAITCALQPFSLKVVPSFESIANACDVLGITANVDIDTMYDELSSTKMALEKCVADVKCDSAAEKWQTFFISCGEHIPVNLFKVVSYVLSIPASNAFCERIFSLMNTKWRSERNRATVELVCAELQVSVNFSQSCTEFYDFALKDQKLLDAAASNKKYTCTFKKK